MLIDILHLILDLSANSMARELSYNPKLWLTYSFQEDMGCVAVVCYDSGPHVYVFQNQTLAW